ncbi:MAG TPA: MFS transporter [Bacteroidales bacterium]|nr:MFS transporter [Bacteroidales bacterium]HQH23440.1 MFS transporter [Bacteroidales bacterium]
MKNNAQILPGELSAGGRSRIFVIITAFCSLLAIVGFALYGLPFFYDFYINEFGWSRAVVTSGNALGKLLVAPLFGFIAGWIIDRYGPKNMLMAGALMTGGALVGLAAMNSLGVFYVSYIFVALGYVFGGPLPCQVLISRWFTKDRGKAMGIAYLGIGTGGFLVPLIAAGLISNFGWRIALVILAGMIVLIAFPLALFVRNSPAESRTKAGKDAATEAGIKAGSETGNEAGKETRAEAGTEVRTEAVAPIRNILKNPWFYMLALGSMCSIAAVGGVNQHLKLYLLDHDFSQTRAAHVISLVLLMSLVGRVLMGWLADLFSRKYVMILIYLIVAGSIPLLLLPDFPGRIYIFAVIFGIGLGGDYMIIPLMAGDMFGVKTLGRVMGIVLVADGIAEASMPMLVGVLRDNAGNYTTALILLIAIALAGAVIISFLPEQRKISG